MKNIEHLLVSANTLIIDVVKVINESIYRIALIVDHNKVLIGTLTDGDVRRGLLSGVDLNDHVSSIMNSSPISVSENTPEKIILELMDNRSILQIPIVDEKNRVVSLELKSRLNKKLSLHGTQNKTSDVWIILMLGGLGSRLHPLTEDTPKPMLKIGDRPLLETTICNFKKQGFKKFVFSVNYKPDIIRDHFGDGSNFGIEISYLKEEKKMGTAGSLSLLKDKPPEPFIVMNGDLLTNISFIDLMDFHYQNDVLGTMCVREYTHEIPYGIVKNTGVELETIIEKPSKTYFVNAGIYILDPKVLEFIPDDEFYDMPSLFENINKKGGSSVVFPIHEYWLDIGNLKDLEKARKEYIEIFT